MNKLVAFFLLALLPATAVNAQSLMIDDFESGQHKGCGYCESTVNDKG